jgi:hypothetical protein
VAAVRESRVSTQCFWSYHMRTVFRFIVPCKQAPDIRGRTVQVVAGPGMLHLIPTCTLAPVLLTRTVSGGKSLQGDARGTIRVECFLTGYEFKKPKQISYRVVKLKFRTLPVCFTLPRSEATATRMPHIKGGQLTGSISRLR